MRILNYLKNSDSGFTLLECILAVGILATMLASLVGLQSSIIFVAQNSMDKLKAAWSMRQTYAQIDYLLDSGGFAAVPEQATFVWSADKKFTIVVTRKDLNDIKPSQFLITALKFYNLANPGGNENLNVDRMIAPITQFLDNTPVSQTPGSVQNTAISKNANQSNFANVLVSVNWDSGSTTSTSSSFSDGLFLMDLNALANLKLPNFNNSNDNNNNNNQNNNNPPPNNQGGGKP